MNKLDLNHAVHGFVLRTTKGDDERKLREANSSVTVLQILKNGTYFTVPALQSLADRYVNTQLEYKLQQQSIVEKALDTATTYLPVVESVASIIAELDVLVSFAMAAAVAPGDYVRPTLHAQGSGVLNLKDARHPCVELMDDMQFIANDYEMKRGESNFQVITGPNMGGKSTYIRGIGSIVVMAQIGMFVPCSSAELSVVDCILARVGAGDAVQKGVSTFMAEMLESSVILQAATKDSLLIIDELGRGTSTFDGFGLAWAISDYIVSKIGCMCLFATHFHELTALEGQHAGVKNKHVAAHIQDNQMVLLYRLRDGPCTQSFGIHVSQMAGFPREAILRAKRKAAALECHPTQADGAEGEGEGQKQDTQESSSGGEVSSKQMRASLRGFAELEVESMDVVTRPQMQALFPAVC